MDWFDLAAQMIPRWPANASAGRLANLNLNFYRVATRSQRP